MSAGDRSPARRVGSREELELPGDYAGPFPVALLNGTAREYVWFLLPIHRGKDMYDHSIPGSGLNAIYSPMWEFRECPDGSLEISPSISVGLPAVWHGYLHEGNIWQEV